MTARRRLVAAIAAEHDLPYACIPSGTRNHFALDLGVDREDVVGALDAFVDGGERYVDLGEVNGRVFVNNVSLGVYAQAVSQDDYRESKLRTLLDTLTDTLGAEGETVDLRWTDPDGAAQVSAALVLVSNNPYLLGPTLGTGTRPRLDRGLLGIVDFHPPTPGMGEQAARWRELAAAELEIEADGPVAVGIDGESLTLEPPLRFRVRRRALRARIARDHPGASPSAEIPHGPLSVLRELLRVAGRLDHAPPPLQIQRTIMVVMSTRASAGLCRADRSSSTSAGALGVPRSSRPLVLGPLIANDGVPVKPSRWASSVVAVTSSVYLGPFAVGFPLGDVLHAGAFGDGGEEFVVGVARVLLALVAVEELDEVPAATLFAGRQRRGPGRDRLRADDREVAEDESSPCLP